MSVPMLSTCAPCHSQAWGRGFWWLWLYSKLLLTVVWVCLTSGLELVTLCQWSCWFKTNGYAHTMGEGGARVAAVLPVAGTWE